MEVFVYLINLTDQYYESNYSYRPNDIFCFYI